MRRFVTALTLISLAAVAPMPLYGTASAAPAPRPAAARTSSHPIHSSAMRHVIPASKARVAQTHRAFSLKGHLGEQQRFSPAFVRSMQAAMKHTAPKINPQRTVDYGRVIAVGSHSITVQQQMPFHLAHAPSHSKHLFTVTGSAAPVEQVLVSPSTLVTLPGKNGQVVRLHGTTNGLHTGATVVVVGKAAGTTMQALVIANLAANRVHQIAPSALRHPRMQYRKFQLSGSTPKSTGTAFHKSTTDSQQSGNFTGCFPDPYCIVNQYTNVQATFTAPNQEDQGGLTIYDDGSTRIFLQSVGYSINADDFVYNWPMTFKSSAPTGMHQTQQQPINLSVEPQQITQGQYTFAGGLGISYGATFNVTVAGFSTQTQVGAGYGVINTTSDPAPLAGTTLDVPALQCFSIAGFDFKGASLAGVNLCFDISFEGANVGTRFTPTGAHLVDAVGNPVASPAQGSLSATPRPLFVVPDAQNWSLGLDHFYWAPKFSLSGYIQFQATLGAGPAGLTCTCSTWNTPALTFPGYPVAMPMIDTDPADTTAAQQYIHLGDPLGGPQTSSLTYSYTAAPAPTVLTYTGGTNFKTGNQLGVSANLVDNQGDPVVGRNVNFILNGGYACSGVTDALGHTSCYIDITGLGPSQYVLTTTFFGGQGYAPSSVISRLALSATGLVMEYVGHTHDLGQDSSYFAVDIVGLNGDISRQTPGIASLNITFYLNGVQMCSPDTTNDETAVWIQPNVFQLSCHGFMGTRIDANTVIGFPSGAYTVTASLGHNDYFTLPPVSAAFTIDKLPTNLTSTGATTVPYHGATTFSADLQSPNGHPQDAPVLFTVGTGAQSQSCTAVAGVYGPVSCSVPSLNLPPGNYTLTMSFVGSDIWLGTSTSVPFTVTKGSSALTYTGPATAAFHAKGVVLAATLAQPNSGVSIVGQILHFALGNQSCDATTDINGAAYCQIGQITQHPGSTLTVSYAGSNLYDGASINPPFTITPAVSALTYNGPASATYHDALTMSATLSEAAGGAPLTNQPVHFALVTGAGSQQCDGISDAQGNASCTIPSLTLTPSSAQVIVNFNGNQEYVPSTTNNNFTLNQKGTHLRYTGAAAHDYQDSVTLSGVLTEGTDGAGNGIADQTLTFTLGSQGCTGTTDSSGLASCTIAAVTQATGSSSVGLAYAGNANYIGSTGSALFTVQREETALAYTGTQQLVANGQSFTLSAHLTDPADATEGESASDIGGKPVTLTLGSQSCGGTTAADGTASCTISAINQTNGMQTVSVSFPGDASYIGSSDSGQHVLVYSNLSNGGAFVLGDQSVAGAAAGSSLTFWSAQWSSLNRLSGGAAPASFKGYGTTAGATPVCGSTWSSSPGNSSTPPSSIPTYMPVVVTGNVTQSGSTISGTVSKVVIVKTNPGYAGNPGSAGTGVVVATVCG